MAHEPPVNESEDRLDFMLRTQREFQEQVIGYGPLVDMTPQQRAEYFRTQSLSLMFELGEASNEIAWKPWAKSEHFRVESYRAELIDAWHFLMNLMLLAGMTGDDITRGYIDKQAKNRDRQRNGYDGVTGKCPSCRRDYNDAGVLCTPTHTDPGDGMGWCEIDGTTVRHLVQP